jgi:hypothetical protein
MPTELDAGPTTADAADGGVSEVSEDKTPDAGHEVEAGPASGTTDEGNGTATTVPPSTRRCQVGVDCDKVAFDCSPCNDGNYCTSDYCDVDTQTLTRTCSSTAIADTPLCVAGVSQLRTLFNKCEAVGRTSVGVRNGLYGATKDLSCTKLSSSDKRDISEVISVKCCPLVDSCMGACFPVPQ